MTRYLPALAAFLLLSAFTVAGCLWLDAQPEQHPPSTLAQYVGTLTLLAGCASLVVPFSLAFLALERGR